MQRPARGLDPVEEGVNLDAGAEVVETDVVPRLYPRAEADGRDHCHDPVVEIVREGEEEVADDDPYHIGDAEHCMRHGWGIFSPFQAVAGGIGLGNLLFIPLNVVPPFARATLHATLEYLSLWICSNPREDSEEAVGTPRRTEKLRTEPLHGGVSF